jgi:hypothetical protein
LFSGFSFRNKCKNYTEKYDGLPSSSSFARNLPQGSDGFGNPSYRGTAQEKKRPGVPKHLTQRALGQKTSRSLGTAGERPGEVEFFSGTHFERNRHTPQQFLEQLLLLVVFWKNLQRASGFGFNGLLRLNLAGARRLFERQQPVAEAVTVFPAERGEEILIKLPSCGLAVELPVLFEPCLKFIAVVGVPADNTSRVKPGADRVLLSGRSLRPETSGSARTPTRARNLVSLKKPRAQRALGQKTSRSLGTAGKTKRGGKNFYFFAVVGVPANNIFRVMSSRG